MRRPAFQGLRGDENHTRTQPTYSHGALRNKFGVKLPESGDGIQYQQRCCGVLGAYSIAVPQGVLHPHDWNTNMSSRVQIFGGI
jgi:hypothetical protein